jgi:hypothetical protein
LKHHLEILYVILHDFMEIALLRIITARGRCFWGEKETLHNISDAGLFQFYGRNIFLIDNWQDSALDQVPILIQRNWNERLYVDLPYRSLLVCIKVLIIICLNRDTYQRSNGVCQLLGKIRFLMSESRTGHG